MPEAKPVTVCGPESSATVWFPAIANAGASLTGLTVIVKVLVVALIPLLAVPPSSHQSDGDDGRAVGVGSWRVCQIAGSGVDRRTQSKQAVVVR